MPLSPARKFTLQKLDSEGQPLAKLTWSDMSDMPGVEIEGATLEGQFQTESGTHVLVLTDDCPFEESIRCYLLSKENTVVDQLTFATPYQSLIIEKIEVSDDHSLILHCSSDVKLKIDLNETSISMIKRVASGLGGVYHSKNGLITLTEKPPG